MQQVIIKEYTRVYGCIYTVAKIIREKSNLPPEGVRFIRKNGRFKNREMKHLASCQRNVSIASLD